MKILIAGTEEYADYDFLKKTCSEIIAKEQYKRVVSNKDLEFVSGHAPRGADWYGEKFAKELGFTPKLFPANWNDLDEMPCNIRDGYYGKYNSLAGFNRNQRMADYISQDGIAIAFRINNSPGTTDMIRRAKKSGATVYQIDYDKDKKMKIWNEKESL